MKKTQLSDEELVKKYQSGDKKAFDIIIERYSRKIYTVIFNIIRDTMITQDILQDTFLKSMNHIDKGKYIEEGSFGGWLARIAYNLAIDSIRLKKRIQQSYSLPSTDDVSRDEYPFHHPIATQDRNPEERMIDKETMFNIRELIETLPDEQKEVVLLRHFHDFDFQSIADYTGVSINTALGRMRYALINLRREIDYIKSNGKKTA